MKLNNLIINKIKYILLTVSILLLGWTIHSAINNYQLRFYLKKTYDALKHDTISTNYKKIIDLHAVFYGFQEPNETEIYSIRDIGKVFENGFSYFTGIKIKEKKNKL